MTRGDLEAEPPRLRTALGWSAVLNTGRRLTTTLVTLVLAGILGPAAFGTVAIATIYVLLLQLLFQQGFAPALIQRTALDTRTLDTAFRLVLTGSVLLALATVLVSDGLGRLLDDPKLPLVVSLLSLQLPLQALGLVQESILRRQSDFRTLALRTNAAAFAGGAAGIGGALAGADVYALVAQQLVSVTTSTVLTWTRTDWRPSLRRPASLRTDTARGLVAFSNRASLASGAQFAGAQVDAFVVAGAFSPVAVGLYRLAGRLVETVLDMTVRTAQTTFLSDLARHQDDPGALRRRAVRQHRLACTVGMPPFGILAGCSAALVGLLGDAWSAAATPLTVIAIGSIGSVFVAIAAPLLQASGRAGAYARLQVASAALTGFAVALAAVYLPTAGSTERGLLLIAVARGAVATSIVVVVHLIVLRRMFGLDPSRMLAASVPGLLATVAALTAGLLAQDALRGTFAPPAAVAVLTVLTASAAAIAAVVLVERRQVLEMGRRYLRTVRASEDPGAS